MLVSILLPAYNAGPFVAEAIESMLNQSYTDFELIIINDYSTDNTEEQILSFADPRIRYIKNEQNSGLIYNLNLGFSIAAGKYIVRMDADDVSLPTRIAEQVSFMETHKSIGICGSWYLSFDNDDGIKKFEVDNDAIKLRMLYQCHLCHPTVIIRKSLIDENELSYNKAYIHAEDYELWSRMAFLTNFANIGNVLLKYRAHDKNVSNQYTATQVENSRKVIQAMFQKFNLDAPMDTVSIWVRACNADFNLNIAEIRTLENVMNTLLTENKRAKYVSQPALEDFISEKWYNLCYNNVKNKEVKTIFNNSNITKLLPIKSLLKFKVKALI